MLELAWSQTLFSTRAAGSIHSMEADGAGVLVSGKDDLRAARPFVARYSQNGRLAFRTLVAHSSGSAPMPGTAVALASSTGGAAYVLADAWSRPDPGLVLARLDERGALVWSRVIAAGAQPAPVMAADAEGGVLVAGAIGVRPGSGSFTATRYAPDGAVIWTRSYPFDVSLVRMVRGAQGGFLLVGSAGGGGKGASSAQTIRYQCAGETASCAASSRALWMLRLDGEGNASTPRRIGTPEHVIAVSDAAAHDDGVVVTGEFRGPALDLGAVTLCEVEPGMPAVERRRRIEPVAGDPCDCLGHRADLFVIRFDDALRAVWGGIVAVGAPRPRVVVDARGGVTWSATLASASAPGAAFSLWELDAAGVPRARRTSIEGPLVARGPEGSLYISDTRSVGRAKRRD